MRSPLRLLFVVLLLSFVGSASAQESPDRVNQFASKYSFGESMRSAGMPAVTEIAVGDMEQGEKRYHEFLMQQLRNKVVFSVLLGITALIAHCVVLRSFPRTERSASHIVSATGLIYIVFGTIILVVIATTDQQLTASMGILGAVAGYLFGKSQGDQREPDEANSGLGATPSSERRSR